MDMERCTARLLNQNGSTIIGLSMIKGLSMIYFRISKFTYEKYELEFDLQRQSEITSEVKHVTVVLGKFQISSNFSD